MLVVVLSHLLEKRLQNQCIPSVLSIMEHYYRKIVKCFHTKYDKNVIFVSCNKFNNDPILFYHYVSCSRNSFTSHVSEFHQSLWQILVPPDHIN